jgi:2-phospho-L-lactate guanylyltransferase
MRTVAVLPIKRFERAKRRLEEELPPGARASLALAMAADVMRVVSEARTVARVLVVTGDGEARALATELGFDVLAEPRLAGHSRAATAGVSRALVLGAERVLLLAGDCPLLRAERLDGWLAGRTGDGVVVVADRHGTGTNALLLAPPDAIAPAFGPGSCARHRRLAAAAGLPVEVERVAGLDLDVDTAADLAALRHALEADPDAAAATRAQLASRDELASR